MKNKYYKLSDALKNGEEIKITMSRPTRYALDLTLDELCDLLIAVNVQEDEYLKMASKYETDDFCDYCARKANTLHNIGDMVYFTIFGHERSN